MTITQFPDPLPIEVSARGGRSVAVTLQDQTTGVLDLPFLQAGSAITLAADTVVDDNDITLTAGHGLTTVANAGDVIELADNVNGSFFMQCEIVTVVGDVVTLDCPVNRIYTVAGSTVSHSIKGMNVLGSIASPEIFSVEPLVNQSGDMTRIICEIRDNTGMDFETFGGLTALTNGVVIRVNNGDGTFRNLYNFKSNGDIILQSFDHDFATNIGGGTRGFTARITWAGQTKHGVAIRLDGAVGTGEKLEIVIQDDLTGLTRMHWVAQGSELQGD
jgi:hypothetical protein